MINLNPIENLFQLVEDELQMKLKTLEDGTNGIINAPLQGDFSIGMDWNKTLSQVNFQFSNYSLIFFQIVTFLTAFTNNQTSIPQLENLDFGDFFRFLKWPDEAFLPLTEHSNFKTSSISEPLSVTKIQVFNLSVWLFDKTSISTNKNVLVSQISSWVKIWV